MLSDMTQLYHTQNLNFTAMTSATVHRRWMAECSETQSMTVWDHSILTQPRFGRIWGPMAPLS